MTWTYRPALDGLRSVAVYLVLLFHAGLAWADGGFVGVDLFFVLSGFLVSSILLTELDETGSVRLWRFYARRVRRLLPAAVVVIVATAAVFVVVASSVRRLPLVGDAQAALLYVANWRFLGQENDYFGADIDRSPYLHFWSLAIEEQFYVVFPLLLLGLAALARRRRALLPVGVAVLFGASLVAQLVWAANDTNHAYYGTDARAYQLLAGVLAALAWRRLRTRDRLPEFFTTPAAPVGAVLLVVVASGLVDMSASVRGMAATVASVLLVLGLTAGATGPLARVLSLRAPVYLGKISYGTYLWHWPVILVLLEVLDTSPYVIAALTLGIATGLACLSYEILEHPIRSSRALGRFAPQVVAAGLTASVLVALLVAPPLLESDRRPALAATTATEGPGGPGRAVPADIDWTRYANDIGGAKDTYCTEDDLESCIVARGSSGLHVALVGDSEARMLAPALQELAAEHDFTLSLNVLVSCSWQDDLYRESVEGPATNACRKNRDAVYGSVLKDMGVDVVVLGQLPHDRGKYLRALEPLGATAEKLDAFNYDSMASTLEKIRGAGARSIILRPLIEVPDSMPEPLECLSAANRTSECRVPVPLEPPPSDAFFRSFAASTPGVGAITINDLMCPDAPLCETLRNGVPVWRDRDHYAPAAVTAVKDELWERLVAAGLEPA